MLKTNLEKIINQQINKEIYSEYLYLSMAAYCAKIGLDGFSNWFRVQVQEERAHAMKFFDYLLERGSEVKLEMIEKPQVNFKSIIQLFEITVEHEQFVTKSINKIVDLALKEKDHALVSFLNWFVDEQVEEEATAEKLLSQVKLIGENGSAIYMLDKELAQRVFVPIANN
jgi:ferritin